MENMDFFMEIMAHKHFHVHLAFQRFVRPTLSSTAQVQSVETELSLIGAALGSEHGVGSLGHRYQKKIKRALRKTVKTGSKTK